jgi:WD40 repeat protein
VTSGFDKRLIIWDAAALAPRQEIDTPHKHAIISVEFSPDGRTLASVDGGGYILFWDTTTWAPRYELRQVTPATVLIDLAFTPDSRMLAAGSFDGMIHFWDVKTGEELPDPIQAYINDWALSVAFDPTGTRLATGGKDGVIKLWDVATRQPIAQPLTGHSNRVTDLVYSPDGKVLASASADGTVRFWNAANGVQVAEPYASSTAAVWNVAFAPQNTPDGMVGFYALSGDGAVAAWDMTGHKLLRPLLRTHLETEEMKGDANGGRFFLASTGDRALALTAPGGDWLADACAVANRSLTQAEWDKYMTGLPFDPVCR